MSWSASQYSKFENERNRPIRDLLAQIPDIQVKRAMDIGCGPGNSTELLQKKYPGAMVEGLDSSEDMIEAARKRLPDISFEVADISSWQGAGSFDIILANASLQWVTDHEKLFPALLEKLSDGGCIALQIPDNLDEPVQHLMRSVAAEGAWSGRIAKSSKRFARQTPEWYYQLLRDKTSSLDIWRIIYYHQLEGGVEAIVEWFKGTGLRPFLDPLNEEEKKSFLSRYTEELKKAFTVYPDGKVLLPFPRLFIIAIR